MAAVTGQDPEELKAQVITAQLYSEEDSMYEAQSVLNFYKARIEPYLEKAEKPEDFDKRFREWRFRTCAGCGETFAYAWNYEGVGTCSLECAEEALAKIGIIFSRHHDLKKRWGYFYHPAIVSSSALKSLRSLYADAAPDSFAPDESYHPNLQAHHVQSHNLDIDSLPHSPDNMYE